MPLFHSNTVYIVATEPVISQNNFIVRIAKCYTAGHV